MRVVVSTGRCNTSMKNVRRCVKAERLARPLIELQSHFVQVRLGVAGQVAALGIEGVLVIAFTADQPARRFQARTGKDGMVKLPVDRAGRWLVKAVHMIPVPATDPAADWESFWASLTFEVRAREPLPAR